MNEARTEAVAAWAVGVGVGLIVVMVTWLVGNRLADLVWDTPVGPTVAFATAIVAGVVTSLVAGARLNRVVRREG